jgi:hypothetical protein
MQMLSLRSAVARACTVAPTASIKQGIRRVVSQQRRLYGADHHDDHHDHKPAAHKTSFRQPLPVDLPKTPEQRKKELEEASGWLFGSQVVYVDPDKPFEHQYKNANGWMWGRPVRESTRFRRIFLTRKRAANRSRCGTDGVSDIYFIKL